VRSQIEHSAEKRTERVPARARNGPKNSRIKIGEPKKKKKTAGGAACVLKGTKTKKNAWKKGSPNEASVRLGTKKVADEKPRDKAKPVERKNSSRGQKGSGESAARYKFPPKKT